MRNWKIRLVRTVLSAVGSWEKGPHGKIELSRPLHGLITSSCRYSRVNVMALELRPNCECCDRDLPPASTVARICSYECTFCADCVDNVLFNVCPNCGGGFVPRPIRPATEWRTGLSIAKRPPLAKRVFLSYSREDISAHSQRIRNIPPADR
jgi:uncharacterized protein